MAKQARLFWGYRAFERRESYGCVTMVLQFKRFRRVDMADRVAEMIRHGCSSDAEYYRGIAELVRAYNGSTVALAEDRMFGGELEIVFQCNAATADHGHEWYAARVESAGLTVDVGSAIRALANACCVSPHEAIEVLKAQPVKYIDGASYWATRRADDMEDLRDTAMRLADEQASEAA